MATCRILPAYRMTCGVILPCHVMALHKQPTLAVAPGKPHWLEARLLWLCRSGFLFSVPASIFIHEPCIPASLQRDGNKEERRSLQMNVTLSFHTKFPWLSEFGVHPGIKSHYLEYSTTIHWKVDKLKRWHLFPFVLCQSPQNCHAILYNTSLARFQEFYGLQFNPWKTKGY